MRYIHPGNSRQELPRINNVPSFEKKNGFRYHENGASKPFDFGFIGRLTVPQKSVKSEFVQFNVHQTHERPN